MMPSTRPRPAYCDQLVCPWLAELLFAYVYGLRQRCATQASTSTCADCSVANACIAEPDLQLKSKYDLQLKLRA